MRILSLLLVSALLAPVQTGEVAAPRPFDEWLQDLIAEARERGFDEDLVHQTLSNLQPRPIVIERDRSQAELTLTFERYFATRVTPQVIRRGRELARGHRELLDRIEREYGVPSSVVLAIWGLESRYGRNTGITPVFQALATLAWEPRRSSFFRGELFNALTIASGGFIEARTMTGSWAGAMGQPQFMPSSYLRYAVDFDEDGRRDIWRSTPDALASIANYLKGYGWIAGEIWGREVTVTPAVRARIDETIGPRGEGCSAIRDTTERRPLSEWTELGVRRRDGGPLPQVVIDAALATVGERSFLVYQNYDALLGYNCAHHYALSVAMLAERLR